MTFVVAVVSGLAGGVFVFTLFSILTGCCLSELQLDLIPDEMRGNILTASATILGLASLGSLIGIRLSSDLKQAETQRAGVAMVASCIILVITIQVLSMMHACCYELKSSTYMGYLVTTGISCIAIMCGYTVVVSAQAKESEYDSERTITLKGGLREYG